MKTKKRVGKKHDSGKPPVSQFLRQFPLALAYVSRCSEYGHNTYGEEEDAVHWDNWRHVENAKFRYNQAAGRHFIMPNNSLDDKSGLLHISHSIWNQLAVLQLTLEEQLKPNKKKCN